MSQDARETRNTRRFITSNAFQQVGDQFIAAKTVLPWLLTSLGSASWVIGLLVPVRESGSMLPQAALSPWVTSKRRRVPVWVLGALIQGAFVALMSLIAAFGHGTWAGLGILLALAGMSFGRSLSSISSKDVMGRTISKGRRGRVTGISTAVGGAVALTVGLGIRLLGGEGLPSWFLAALILGGSFAWFIAAAVFRRVEEEDAEPSHDDEAWLSTAWKLLRDDRHLRLFVTVRSLLLVSALSPAFLVAISAEQGAQSLGGLGPFLIASGLAALLAGRISGKLADRSSRTSMTWGAGIASAILVVAIAVARWGSQLVIDWGMPVLFFLLAVVHTDVRVARKTYVVDMAEGDQRTKYVAVANTAMGVILLVVGLLSGGLAMFGNVVALGFLAVLGAVGCLLAARLPDVSAG